MQQNKREDDVGQESEYQPVATRLPPVSRLSIPPVSPLLSTLLAMSRSESPASSLDFYDSDPSEEEFRPQRAKRGPKKLTIKLNLAGRASQAAPEEEFDASYDAYNDAAPQSHIVDLSEQDLVRDHEIRPLWVDEQGNMYVSLRTRLTAQHPRSICCTGSEGSRLSHRDSRTCLSVRA